MQSIFSAASRRETLGEHSKGSRHDDIVRLSGRDFDGLFTKDKPVIFNFHGYPWLIHRLAYRRTNHHNFHVRGYKEKGNINTPLELAILNQTDRFSLAIGRDRWCAEAAIFRGARKGKIPQSATGVPHLRLRERNRQTGNRPLEVDRFRCWHKEYDHAKGSIHASTELVTR